MTYSDNQPRNPLRKKQRPGRRPSHRHLSIEPLESRRMRAVFTVSSLDDAPVSAADQAPGTLRQAIFDANLSSGDDEIVFDAALTSGGPATIQLLAAGELLIDGNLTIGGPGASLMTIRAYDPTPETKNGDGARLFRIETSLEGSVVTIQELTLTGGDVTGAGGAILNRGILTVVACTISDNSATGEHQIGGGGGGIAISATGSATVADSTVTGNFASGDYAYGGGISAAGYLSVVRSMITGNRASGTDLAYGGGGGIDAATGVIAKISDSTISGNLAEGPRARGGGISAGGDLTVERAKISGNKAEGQTHSYGGGINASAQTVITDSEIDSNEATLLSEGTSQGGGINSRQSLMISNSSIVENSSAQFGGGLSVESLAIITNSTLSGNSASQGGGISVRADSFGSVTTITANRADVDGGGLHVGSSASAALDHTIVAGNELTSSQRQDISGTAFARYSLIGDDTGASVVDSGGNLIGDASTPIDPQLGPLANNGGPTRTHMPLTGSIVIDAGDPALMVGNDGVPPTDQRGLPFTRVFDGKLPAGAQIDIGAVEKQDVSPPLLLGDFNLDRSVDAADYTIWRDTLTTMVNPFGGADADGNGKIEEADYEIWKLHFGETLDPLGTAAGSGSVELVAATVVTLPAEPAAAPLAVDASMLLNTNRKTTSTRELARRSADSLRTRPTDALLNLKPGPRQSPKPTSDASPNANERGDATTSSVDCNLARATDAVFHSLGQHSQGQHRLRR
jgi:hypothetical protein